LHRHLRRRGLDRWDREDLIEVACDLSTTRASHYHDKGFLLFDKPERGRAAAAAAAATEVCFSPCLNSRTQRLFYGTSASRTKTTGVLFV